MVKIAYNIDQHFTLPQVALETVKTMHQQLKRKI